MQGKHMLTQAPGIRKTHVIDPALRAGVERRK